jgi:hypothetical protein
MVVGVTVQLKHTELLVNHCKKQVFFFLTYPGDCHVSISSEFTWY